MQPLPSFHLQLAAEHISHAAAVGAAKGARRCRVCTFFLLRGFRFHSPAGYTCRKTVRNGQRGAKGRGGKNSWMGFKENVAGGWGSERRSAARRPGGTLNSSLFVEKSRRASASLLQGFLLLPRKVVPFGQMCLHTLLHAYVHAGVCVSGCVM